MCPKGHASEAPDWCSVCGAKIDGQATEAMPPVGSDDCPSCSSPQEAGTKFCEVCGYDFATGTLPAAPKVQPAGPAATVTATATWTVVVSADRQFYDRNNVTEVQFPLGAADRTFELTDERVTIGRRSASRGVTPVIDLANAPEDAAVSHTHATLLRQPDGSYSVVDNGSTNGTFLNDSDDAIVPNVPIALADGDHINMGAFTRVEIKSRRA
jgi:DNA-binding beta-propeller fold protein YncE